MEVVVGPLLRQFPADDDPLVESQTVNHQQRDLVQRRIVHVPREKAGEVVEHDGRHRRQVDQSPVAFLDPLREGGVDSRSQRLDLPRSSSGTSEFRASVRAPSSAQIAAK